MVLPHRPVYPPIPNHYSWFSFRHLAIFLQKTIKTNLPACRWLDSFFAVVLDGDRPVISGIYPLHVAGFDDLGPDCRFSRWQAIIETPNAQVRNRPVGRPVRLGSMVLAQSAISRKFV